MPQCDKSLLILRHGKAGAAARDFDRPLTERGRHDAEAIGNWMRAEGLLPEHVIASAARRTTETARLCCAAAGADADAILLLPELYGADCAAWRAELASVSEEARVVLLVGHNPTLSWLVGELGGSPMMLSTADLVWLEPQDAWDGAMLLRQVVRSAALRRGDDG